jgi:hypothetical protein
MNWDIKNTFEVLSKRKFMTSHVKLVVKNVILIEFWQVKEFVHPYIYEKFTREFDFSKEFDGFHLYFSKHLVDRTM